MKYEEGSARRKLILAQEDQLRFGEKKSSQKSNNLKELKIVRKAFKIFLLLREQLKMLLQKQ